MSRIVEQRLIVPVEEKRKKIPNKFKIQTIFSSFALPHTTLMNASASLQGNFQLRAISEKISEDRIRNF